MSRKLLAVLIGLGLLLCLVGVAEADGSPTRVVLTYLPEVSNWGPQGATGVSELVMAEGEARLTALGLTKLTDQTYVLWLMNSKAGQALKLGQFNSDDQGIASLDVVLPDAIPDAGWDLLLVTVEKAGAVPDKPGAQHSIAGFTDDRSAPAPQQLPFTGGGAPAAPQGWPYFPMAASAVGGGAVGVVAFWGLSRRRKP